MKNTARIAALASLVSAGFLTALSGPAQAQPIRQYQDDHLLGHATYYVDRSWDGVGPESGLLTRARVVTKNVHASPDFVVEGQPYTRTPARVEYGQRTPEYYGVPSYQEVRIFVRMGSTYVVVDPFETFRDRMPSQIRRAQRKWLRDNGYVDRARVVRRVDLSQPMEDRQAAAKPTLPTPRATIEIHPGMKDRLEKQHNELEAKSDESATSGVVILSANGEQNEAAPQINGTITVHKPQADDLQAKAD